MNPPLELIEATLIDIWSLELAQPVQPEDNFFALGGDSIMVIRILYEVKDRLGVVVTPADFFSNPSIAELARIVEAERAEAESAA